ncbi:MAG: hypothetical protein H6825_02830 [Planctomycetes bacterium]|nr:hypothetical protein [Planctomycetota bacterium]
MRSIIKGTALAMVGAAFITSAEAAEILVSSNISTSTTWTANNTYNLQGQIYVLPGATLTIEAGVVVASDPGGSLAVSKGAKICVLGSQTDPVIMTSKADVATWAPMPGHPTGKNPKTGTWREAANEWGNLTLMGDAFISENATAGNVPTCDPDNVAAMEGLVADFPGDTKVLYGGGNDDDDSGTISYLSLRYGGKVIGLGNELNGLSLGGIGRETDIHHVDIMNNVDDGVEIWGGTACLSYFNIWNIGDDSFDIDQGFRGKVQFVLIVQGYSLDASQGSGVGDNCFETDGAEDSDWQPVTTTVVYNATVIGQPIDGDQGTAWRDNARVQYRNCIFMDLGEDLVKFDNVDGDGANGYGFNGTLSWADTWTTDWNAAPPTANDCPPGTYTAQTNGKLAEIRDSVFFRNLKGGGTGLVTDPAYAEATARGVFAPGNNNVFIPGFADVDAPITSITRAAPVVKGGKTMLQVVSLDPRPQGPALERLDDALKPNIFFDGWYENADYRGAFAPGDTWLDQWTASYAFGFTTTTGSWTNPGCDLKGQHGQARLIGSGHAADGEPVLISLHNANPNAIAALFLSVAVGGVPGIPFKFGTLKWDALLSPIVVTTLPEGNLPVAFAWPSGIPAGIELWAQWGIQDPGAPAFVALSNAVYATAR